MTCHLCSGLGSASGTLRAEATFSLSELSCEKQPLLTTVLFSIMHARNLSRDSQAKLIVWSVVKWHEFHRNKKVATTLICYARLTQDSHNALTRSRTGKKTVFLIYLSSFLDRFEWLLAEATFRMPAHTAKMQPLLAGYASGYLIRISHVAQSEVLPRSGQ